MKKLKIFIIILLVISLIPIGINFFVVNKTKNNIYNINNILDKYDYALILGCSVHKDGTPSLMLRDRLDKGIELYTKGIVSKIIISGDHSNDYSEVDVMYNYLINNNITESDIIRDDIGYSTGESIENYNKNYKDKSVILVTQKYHLYRALYISQKYNLKAVGVYAKKVSYRGDIFREVREVLARVKDYFKYMSK